MVVLFRYRTVRASAVARGLMFTIQNTITPYSILKTAYEEVY
jgi:hypothetical protein